MSDLYEYHGVVPDAIREATWCQCTNFTAEQAEAMRLAAELEAENERLRTLLGDLWRDGSVRAAIGEGSRLHARATEELGDGLA